MKILVPFKRVPDPAGGFGTPQYIINPFDEIAIEEALRIRERNEAAEVVGVSITPAAGDEQIRSAIAMGLDRAIRIDDSRPLDPYAVSRILKALVIREHPTLVLLGKQAVDDDSNQVGQMLAGLLGWPQATFVSKIEIISGGAELRCVRETDRGLETIELSIPAVVSVDLRLNEPRYVSLPGLMKARKRPIEVIPSGDLDASVIPRTLILDSRPVPKRTGGTRLESVEDLIHRLREIEKVF